MSAYIDFVNQTYEFTDKEFKVKDNRLFFNGIDLIPIIQKHGTPLKITYLPKVREKIADARKYFNDAISKKAYKGKYIYSYCTKSSHFKFILETCLQEGTEIETSSAYDVAILRKLHQQGVLSKDRMIIANGYKRPLYTQYLSEMINEGFHNCMPILDNMEELKAYEQQVKKQAKLGIRIATDEEPNFHFYTSRLGIRYKDVISFYESRIKPNSLFNLKTLHFFINTGIKDSLYYWNELSKFVEKYCELKKVCPELEYLDIGGGFPIKHQLGPHKKYDFQFVVDNIIQIISDICKKNNVPEPHIITEFGSYTVGESGSMIYSILNQKLQNDKELWYMIDGSFITHLPDTWGINQKFIMLAINNWDKQYKRINIGGLTCDSMDYYSEENHDGAVYLPEINGDQQYIGFFNTGAYQESIGGYGGLQHCLIPGPKHIIIDAEGNHSIKDYVFKEEQNENDMLNILGY